jgi:hypothetical protein
MGWLDFTEGIPARFFPDNLRGIVVVIKLKREP